MGEIEIVARAFCRASGVGENQLITRLNPMMAPGIGYYATPEMNMKPAWEHFKYHAVIALQALGQRKEEE